MGLLVLRAMVNFRNAVGLVQGHFVTSSCSFRQFPWDILAHPEFGDVRPRSYLERRAALLLDVPENVGPPLQVVPATDDRDITLVWYEALRSQGVEGVVAKHAAVAYRAARIWRKVRHAETVDADVVGFTSGPRSRPQALAARLPGGRTVLSQTVSAPTRGSRRRGWLARSPGGPFAPGWGWRFGPWRRGWSPRSWQEPHGMRWSR